MRTHTHAHTCARKELILLKKILLLNNKIFIITKKLIVTRNNYNSRNILYYI